MNYSTEQLLSYNKYLEGKNVFITGPGGTGKTALIRYIEEDARNKNMSIQVCALTGCAAVLLECKAKTVHSWAGIGLGNGTIEDIVHKIMKNNFAKAKWKEIQILIVDEVSMMSQKLFEMLNAIGQKIRRNYNPFGGIQLIFSGDFYQLPPVGNKDEPDTTKFCFESELWFQTFKVENHVIMNKIFRQIDPVYQQILNQIREGRIKRSSNELLLRNVGKIIPNECRLRPTKLFPTRNKVEYINMTEMNNILTKEYEYKSKFHMDLEMSPQERTIRMGYTNLQIQTELMYIQGNLRCDEILKLKIGAQVMCVVNIQLSNGDILCNGAQGIVKDICPDGFPIVKYNNGYQMTMRPHIWPSEFIPGIGVSQVPLILAWALTIHKAQGATLDIAEIDAGSGIFECGQTYVALSRVKSIEGLYLSSFDATRVKINKKVQDFYDLLKNEQYQTINVMTDNTLIPVAQVSIITPIAEATEATLIEHIPIAVAVPV